MIRSGDDVTFAGRHNVGIGFAVGAALLGLLLVFVVPEGLPVGVCNDGWASPSIGRRGACSHHGGVRRSSGTELWTAAAFVVSVAFGVAVAARLEPSQPFREMTDRELIEQAIRKRQRLSFGYTKRGSTLVEPRTIRPSAFRNAGSTSCVVGFCETRRAERTFAIELMEGVEILED